MPVFCLRTRETFTLSGWAKGYGLPNHERDGVTTPTFRLRAVVKYYDMAELTDIDRGLMLSIDASPITTDQAIRQSENKLLAVETNISNWQRKQNQNNNYSATIPYDMERQRTESKEFLNDLVARDQCMIPALITLVHTADTKEKLDADTESIRQCARKHLCSLNILRWQQLEGLNTVLPYGVPKLAMRRTLTTESLAVFMPFRVQEVCHNNGIYFANNAISKNMIMIS